MNKTVLFGTAAAVAVAAGLYLVTADQTRISTAELNFGQSITEIETSAGNEEAVVETLGGATARTGDAAEDGFVTYGSQTETIGGTTDSFSSEGVSGLDATADELGSLSTQAGDDAEEMAEDAAEAVEEGYDKTVEAVEEGYEATAEAVEEGYEAVEEEVEEMTGNEDTVGEDMEEAAEDMSDDVEDATDDTVDAVEEAGDEVEDHMDH